MRSRVASTLESVVGHRGRVVTGSGRMVVSRRWVGAARRELLVLCGLAALGGIEPQLRSHALGNAKARNDKTKQLTALIHCLPYIGFRGPSPRSASSTKSSGRTMPITKGDAKRATSLIERPTY